MYCKFVNTKFKIPNTKFLWQGYGRSLWVMHGMFKKNGGCGYVKKPDFLLNSAEVFDPSAKLPVKTTLKVSKDFSGPAIDYIQLNYPSCWGGTVLISLWSYFEAPSYIFFPFISLCLIQALPTKQVTVYMGEGWYFDFHHTHFDAYSPPDFYARVRQNIYSIKQLMMHCCYIWLAYQSISNNALYFREHLLE